MAAWRGLLNAYQKFLPLKNRECVVTLYEGNTPLIEAPRLAHAIQFPGRLYLKCEGQNPTGSFKDRGMTYAVSKALSQGASAIICASTGNTAASAAAYAARAGMKCVVVIPEGKVALGKLSQSVVHGAHILKIKGNFDESLRRVRALAQQYPVVLVNSINPFRIEGQKTAAFEICDVLGKAPEFHALPVGNAGNITAYWKGYNEYREMGIIKHLPRMLGFQAKGAAPIVEDRVIENPETLATAIRIGDPASRQGAIAARDQSGGLIEAVTDTQILEAYDLLGKTEGVYCEPASCASVAGVKALVEDGLFSAKDTIVCTLTGHGLKDPDTAMSLPYHQEHAESEKDLQKFFNDLGLKPNA